MKLQSTGKHFQERYVQIRYSTNAGFLLINDKHVSSLKTSITMAVILPDPAAVFFHSLTIAGQSLATMSINQDTNHGKNENHPMIRIGLKTTK